MEKNFSLQELYDVLLKPTYIMEVNGRKFTPTEVVVAFDKIQISNFDEIVKVTTAHGGYGDFDQVWWETPKEIDINFTQGIFSEKQLAILTNSRLATYEEDSEMLLTQRERLQSDENGQIELRVAPIDFFYLYDSDGEPVKDFKTIDEKTIGGLKIGSDYVADYGYLYNSGYSTLTIGSQLTNGYFSLQAKTRVKDDITGKVRTGVLIIPKLKLMSGLSMRLGKDANPIVGQLHAVALPVGLRKNETIMQMVFLNDDIDSDI